MTRVGKHFLSRTQNTLTIKEKIHIFDVINVKKTSLHSKIPLEQ